MKYLTGPRSFPKQLLGSAKVIIPHLCFIEYLPKWKAEAPEPHWPPLDPGGMRYPKLTQKLLGRSPTTLILPNPLPFE